MKNRAVTVFVLAYILLGSVYSVTPTFADNDFTIKTILDESKQGILDKFLEFETNGLETPSTADSLYAEGLVQYDEAIALLISGDFENAKDPGLEALSLFEDAYEALLEAEEELVVEQEGYVGDPLAILESIIDLQDEANRIRDLIGINDLGISLADLDAKILSADTNFFQENFTEALILIESAEAILDEILSQIEFKAEEDQDKRVEAFVENLLLDLEDVIDLATELGVDESVINQLKELVDKLTNYDDPSDIFESTGTTSSHGDALSDVDSFHQDKVKLEAELVDDVTDEDSGKAKFEERIGDRIRLSIEIEDVPELCSDFTATIDGIDVIGDFEFDETTPGGVQCDLNLDSRDGDTVPAVVIGHEVIVTNGVITLSGIFSLEGEEEEEVEEIEFGGTLDGDATFDDETHITGSFTLVGETFTIFFNADTEFDDLVADDLVDGLEVEVEATPQNGDFIATEIESEEEEEVEEIEFGGTLDGDATFDDETHITGSFTLVGETFTIFFNADTEFDDLVADDLVDGLEVEVEATPQNGDFIATEIESEDYDEVSGHEEEEEVDDDSDNSGSGNSDDDESDN